MDDTDPANKIAVSRFSPSSPQFPLIFILIAYAAQYVPWVFVPRETYIYHYFPSVPFVVLLITWLFKNEIRKRWIAVAYVAVVVFLFVGAFPVLSGVPWQPDSGGISGFLLDLILKLPGVHWG